MSKFATLEKIYQHPALKISEIFEHWEILDDNIMKAHSYRMINGEY